jgi:hypothetical protein
MKLQTGAVGKKPVARELDRVAIAADNLIEGNARRRRGHRVARQVNATERIVRRNALRAKGGYDSLRP